MLLVFERLWRVATVLPSSHSIDSKAAHPYRDLDDQQSLINLQLYFSHTIENDCLEFMVSSRFENLRVCTTSALCLNMPTFFSFSY